MKSKSTTAKPSRKRSYRQTARAESAEETAVRIVDAFRRFLLTDWYDDITLGRVAEAAGVTIPTILRRFGSKEGVLEAAWNQLAVDIKKRREIPPGDVDAAIRAVVDDYDDAGALYIRALAQEDRIPILRTMNDIGRREHRAWIENAFARQLDGLDPAGREWRVDGLVMALDVYTWKVLRLDRGRPAADVRSLMKQYVNAVLGPDAGPPTH